MHEKICIFVYDFLSVNQLKKIVLCILRCRKGLTYRNNKYDQIFQEIISRSFCGCGTKSKRDNSGIKTA